MAIKIKRIAGGSVPLTSKGAANGVPTLDANQKVVEDPASKGAASGVTANAADGMAEQAQSRVRYFDTVAAAKVATDLKAGQKVIVTEAGRGGTFNAVADATYATPDEGNTLQGDGKQLARVDFLVAPRKQSPTRFEHYAGDLSGLAAATRRTQQEANYWALRKALLAGAESGRRTVLDIPDIFEYYIPTDGTAVPPSAVLGTTQVDVAIPSLWLPRGSRVTIQGGGTLACKSWVPDYTYGFNGLLVPPETTLDMEGVNLEGPDYGFTLDTILVTGSASGTSLTLGGGRTGESFFTGKKVYIHYNRTAVNNGTVITRTIGTVTAGSTTLPLTEALPADWNTGLTAYAGIVLDPQDYSSHLDAHGDDWGTYTSRLIRGWGKHGAGGTDHRQININLRDVDIDGKKIYEAVSVQHGLAKVTVEGGKWTSLAQPLVMFSEDGISQKPVLHVTGTEIHDAAFVPAGQLTSDMSAVFGHSWYIHPNVNSRFIGVISRDSAGTPGKHYSAGGVTESAEYCDYYDCFFETSGEEFEPNNRGLHRLYNCQFKSVNLRGLDTNKTEFYDCELDDVGIAPSDFLFKGGKVKNITNVSMSSTNKLVMDGVEQVTIASGGAYAFVVTIGSPTLTFRKIPHFEILSAYGFEEVDYGDWLFEDVVFKGEPTNLWLAARAGGATITLRRVTQENQTKAFLLKQGGHAPDADTLTVEDSDVSVSTNFTTNQRFVPADKPHPSSIAAAATLPVKPSYNQYTVTGTTTVTNIPTGFTGTLALYFTSSCAIASSGNIRPATTEVRTGWVHLRFNESDNLWYEAAPLVLGAPRRIQKWFEKTGIADNIATSVFRITTPSTGTPRSGSYAVFIEMMVMSDQASSSRPAAKALTAKFVRSIEDVTGAVANTSAVTQEATASSFSSAATTDVGAVTISTVEVDEYTVDVQVAVDITGTTVDGVAVKALVDLMWFNFGSAPTVAAV